MTGFPDFIERMSQIQTERQSMASNFNSNDLGSEFYALFTPIKVTKAVVTFLLHFITECADTRLILELQVRLKKVWR